MIIAEVKDVICHLKSGEVIGYPTEAVYGIGCDPWNQSSVEKIAKIKGRKKRQTFLMVASSIDQLTDLIDISRLSSQVKSSWPGHTTWLIKAKENANEEIALLREQIAKLRDEKGLDFPQSIESTLLRRRILADAYAIFENLNDASFTATPNNNQPFEQFKRIFNKYPEPAQNDKRGLKFYNNFYIFFFIK